MKDRLTDLELNNMAMAVKLSPYAMDLLRVLMVAFPNRILGESLMVYMGANLQDPLSRVNKFIALVRIVNFINQNIERYGFKVDRTGGTPASHYFLRRI